MFHAAHARIQSVDLHGPAGKLEALVNFGAPGAEYAAVVTHPHPLFGGTMHNKVVFHAMKALNGFGIPVLRFNFRGVGASEGEHDKGVGEVEDVQTALNHMKSAFHLPLIFAGFSFGAAVGLQAACLDPDVKAAISIGTPVQADDRVYQYNFLRHCTKPKLFISGERDQFASPEELSKLLQSVPEPKRLVLVPAADHFFAGKLDEYRHDIEGWVRETLIG
jgi:alpha/beta superfamily hydrolase